MRNLIQLLFIVLIVFFTSCSDSDHSSTPQATDVKPSSALSNEQIKEKVAQFYESASVQKTPLDAIKSEFNNQFPGARDIEWEYSKGVYEVDFEIGNTDYEAWYDEQAYLIMYKYDIPVSSLPIVVKNGINSRYPEYKIDDAEKVFKGTVTGYLVELEKGSKETNAYFNEDGTFIADYISESENNPSNNGNTTTPPAEPEINDNPQNGYTLQQIDSLITRYYSSRSVDTNPSTAMANLFNNQFPGTKDVKWEVSNSIYNVDFEINRVDYEAWYDKNGTLFLYKFETGVGALPSVVKTAVNQRYPNFRIDDVDKFLAGTFTGYKISVEKGNLEYETYFGEDGTFIKEYLDN